MPPDLDYSKYAVLIESDQQMKIETDSKELEWKTSAMNLLYEELALEDHDKWSLQRMLLMTLMR